MCLCCCKRHLLLFSIGLYFLVKDISILLLPLPGCVGGLRKLMATSAFDVNIHINLLVDGAEMNDKVTFTFASSAA